MNVASRFATASDMSVLLDLYEGLEEEMVALHGMWPLADGFDEPIADSFETAIDDPDTYVLIGEIEMVPFGFLVARIEELRNRARGEKIGAIRLIYVAPEAREVAVGEAMREHALAEMRGRGLTKFDAHVLPGHRLAKNFFEAGGFSARSIVMHHDDDR